MRTRGSASLRGAALITGLVLGVTLTAPTLASAAPDASAPAVVSAPNGGASTIEAVTRVDPRRFTVTVHSAAMDRDIELQVLRAPDTSVPRPVFYLLNGASGGEDQASNWLDQTDTEQFFSDKNVDVVIPIGGAFSYYTDWKADDPVLGRNQWETFLTKELPPLIEKSLNSNGVRSIGGVSMSGSSVLTLAAHHPGLFTSVASYSGCARTADPFGQEYVRAVVEARGGGNTVNMWGEPDDPLWAYNDAYLQAEGLRGTTIYVSTGSGLPGYDDNPNSPRLQGNTSGLVDRVLIGGAIEAIVDSCTRDFAGRLHDLSIPATVNFRPTGTHSWQYWNDDLRDSWRVLGPSLGL